MGTDGNAFQKAAEALAKVNELILNGDQLRTDLTDIAKRTDTSTMRVEQSLKAETTAFSRSAQKVLEQYQSASREIAGGITGASDQLEATASQIKARAIEAMTDLTEKSKAAIKRVSDETMIAQDKFEKVAQKVGASAADAATRISDAGRLVDAGTALHSVRLVQVSEQLRELLAAFERSAKAIARAEQSIQLAVQETVGTTTETIRAKDEVVALRESMRKQGRALIIAVVLLFLTALGAMVWMYVSSRGS